MNQDTNQPVWVIGAGLAGCEAAWTLAQQGIAVRLYEMKPQQYTPAHQYKGFAELICSNSLKAARIGSAAGMLKEEMRILGSLTMEAAQQTSVSAGGALAVDRERFSDFITERILAHPLIEVVHQRVDHLPEGTGIVASGPLTEEHLAQDIAQLCGESYLSFFDAAAPIVTFESLDKDKVFFAARYGRGEDDYINCPMDKEQYEAFYEQLVQAESVQLHSFEREQMKVYEGCMPVEVMAKRGADTLRYGPLKPVGLTDPHTGRRPWAVVQLRSENRQGSLYNLVGFQTHLKFPEQRRVFRMIPGLEEAEFARYGVMHRNTFIDAPRLLDRRNRLVTPQADVLGVPVYVAGQLAGTEGYCEAIRSGLHVALAVTADLAGIALPELPTETVFGALLAYATDPATKDYQPMHVNFGLMAPLSPPVRNKRARYQAYADRANEALAGYKGALAEAGLLP